MQSAIWTKWAWITEILAVLSEYGFKVVPPDVERAVQQRTRGFLSTNINEEAMDVLRGAPGERIQEVVCFAEVPSVIRIRSEGLPHYPCCETDT